LLRNTGGSDIAVFAAGFHDFSGEALRDFDRFGNAAASATNPGTSGLVPQIAAILQILDANPNGHFLDFARRALAGSWEVSSSAL